MKKILFPLLVLLIAALAGAYLYASRPDTVDVVQLSSEVLEQSLVVTGRVQTESVFPLRAETEGRLLNVAEEGAAVTKGAVLARLQDPDGDILAAQAAAALKAAELALLNLSRYEQPSAAVQARQARLRHEQAHRRVQQALAMGQLLGEEDLRDAREAEKLLADELRLAELRLSRLEKGGLEQQTRETAVVQAREQMRLAELRRQRAHVFSPMDGQVLERLHVAGERIAKGDALLTLASGTGREIIADVDERWLPLLEPGLEAAVLADAWPDRPFTATLLRVAPGVDRDRGTLRIRLSSTRWPDFLREGMTVSVQLAGRPQSKPSLPLSALTVSGPATGVWRLVNGRAVFTPVRPGRRTTSRVEILSGLAPQDQVIRNAAGVVAGRPLRAKGLNP